MQYKITLLWRKRNIIHVGYTTFTKEKVFLKKYFLFPPRCAILILKNTVDSADPKKGLQAMERKGEKLFCALLALSLAAGCGAPRGAGSVSSAASPASAPLSSAVSPAGPSSAAAASADEDGYTSAVTMEDARIEEETVALSSAPAVGVNLKPVASGTLVQSSGKATIDYSNTKDGYVMVRYTASTAKKLKVQVTGPSGTTYTYNISAGADWTTFPLSDGNGGYKVTVFENMSGNKYATVLSVSFTAKMTDQFAPFLRPNQYVDYASAPKTVAKASQLAAGKKDELGKVQAVYNFVVTDLTYDKQKAATVQSGYLVSMDAILEKKKGICFDYAAVMAGMLRSQGVPCKLVVGYAGTAYHAWINVYTKEKGWIDAAVYFNGDTWKLMDPTFASSGKRSASVMKYIGDGSHYTAKYLY